MNLGSVVALPRRTARAVAVKGDSLRASVFEFPVAVVVIGSLYNMAFIQGEDDRSWELFDVFAVVMITTLLLRSGVVSRWGFI